MGWYPPGNSTTATNAFVYCVHCGSYTTFPHECPKDVNRDIIQRLQRIENYLLELSSKGKEEPK